MTYQIPFNKPFIIGKELHYISQCILGGHSAGDGEFTKKCQALMESRFAARKIMLTTSCTSALEMAALLCDLDEDDEVILPSYTFVSTANAFLLRGARPRFVDIRPDTMNIDEQQIEAEINERTRVIAPVHYAGIGCEMDSIMDIAKRHNLHVVEDAAQGVNARYKSSYLGTIGELGAYSFHETKNFICGEGGALVINDSELIERAEIIREKGTNRSKFFRGEVDKYTWVDFGSSFLPSDILAAFLYAQLENMQVITRKREQIFNLYHELLEPLADRGLIQRPRIPANCAPNYHMFYIVVEDHEIQQALLVHLKEKGILAVFHYVPLHTSPMGQQFDYRAGMLPVTESLSSRLIRLPFYFDLNEEEIRNVVGEIATFFAIDLSRQ
jgi:dTDP-4-amino-4,6-dideoxygalactose transaminase